MPRKMAREPGTTDPTMMLADTSSADLPTHIPSSKIGLVLDLLRRDGGARPAPLTC